MGNFFTQPEHKKYGWIRDLPDKRDQFKLYSTNETDSYVMSIDLRSKCPPIYNQGTLGSCTANAIAGAFEYNELKQFPNNPVMPSRLFIYYNERYIENTINTDAGASLRDGMKTINEDGICPEMEWPYDISKFTDCPPKICYELAENYKSISYKKIKQDLPQLKKCLADNFPIVCGISIYDSFESNQVSETGIIPVPDSNESLLGGHAVMLVGYDDNDEKFILRNSWGTSWGDKGYGYIPYDYVINQNLASDFWIIEKIIEPKPDSDSDNDDKDKDNDNDDDNDDNDDNDEDDEDDEDDAENKDESKDNNTDTVL